MADEEITQENNPDVWNSLHATWLKEKQPGWVVTKTSTYQVIQKVDGSLAFKPFSSEALYDTTSF
ncbi:MAG: hypothetical protein A2Z36_02015 [Chloroflexi bacterium RBG_19FT_COMBO_48_23]|nr:MAG: hypothetical protein A2Z36_02015 [Chloroflexi bacterium RBG_19FT_COMBO_48_23]